MFGYSLTMRSDGSAVSPALREPQRLRAEAEIAQPHDVVAREALRQLLDPRQAADADVVVAERHLDGDVLLAEHARDRRVAEHRKAQRARSGARSRRCPRRRHRASRRFVSAGRLWAARRESSRRSPAPQRRRRAARTSALPSGHSSVNAGDASRQITTVRRRRVHAFDGLDVEAGRAQTLGGRVRRSEQLSRLAVGAHDDRGSRDAGAPRREQHLDQRRHVEREAGRRHAACRRPGQSARRSARRRRRAGRRLRCRMTRPE